MFELRRLQSGPRSMFPYAGKAGAGSQGLVMACFWLETSFCGAVVLCGVNEVFFPPSARVVSLAPPVLGGGGGASKKFRCMGAILNQEGFFLFNFFVSLFFFGSGGVL